MRWTVPSKPNPDSDDLMSLDLSGLGRLVRRRASKIVARHREALATLEAAAVSSGCNHNGAELRSER